MARKVLFDAKSKRWEFLLSRPDFEATGDLVKQVQRQVQVAASKGYTVEIRCQTDKMRDLMKALFEQEEVQPIRVIGPNAN